MRKQIKYLAMDVDGTLTDGKIYMGDSGELFKAFDIKDGYAIHNILPVHSITPIIITGRKSQIIINRALELGITHIYQGCNDKLQKLNEVCKGDLSSVAYIGDDIPDIKCMEFIKNSGGIIGCPADAVAAIRNIVDYKCKRSGGNGAVREFIEWICS